jgi:hypothetical protein
MEMSGAAKCRQHICLFCAIQVQAISLLSRPEWREICNRASSQHGQLIVAAEREEMATSFIDLFWRKYANAAATKVTAFRIISSFQIEEMRNNFFCG